MIVIGVEVSKLGALEPAAEAGAEAALDGATERAWLAGADAAGDATPLPGTQPPMIAPTAISAARRFEPAILVPPPPAPFSLPRGAA
ncbi:MAG TPA: hypothetical protein VFS32_06185 [Candidatus Limnocylindrales bacterium]|nr:hypothetical protein [Candidatus Limnocylindrales bacterium]